MDLLASNPIVAGTRKSFALGLDTSQPREQARSPLHGRDRALERLGRYARTDRSVLRGALGGRRSARACAWVAPPAAGGRPEWGPAVAAVDGMLAYMKRTTVKLPDDLDARLRHEAERRGSTVSELTREAIEAHLGAGLGRRKLIASAAGRSGSNDVSVRIEGILRNEVSR